MKERIQDPEFQTQKSYAFVLDASACSGCKACQVACKDKNQLPLGVRWRRVYEVTGGGWKYDGDAWTSTVFAYNLSVACNHCAHPKCAGVCPTDAYSVRDDGIVLLDTSKCMGCGYCAWACPYEAPQYDRAAGHMTKCDFCIDNIEQGLPPACVAACPLRVLDYARVGEGQALVTNWVALWEAPAEAHPYPMPGQSRTRPHLAIKPHAGMKSGEEKGVANREEVRQRVTGWEEMPLVIFTLLVQMAVGGVWAMLWLLPGARLQVLPLLWIGLCLGIGMIASFAHLGTKRNAWRALKHLRKSWLSRELLFTLLFGAGWAASFALNLLHTDFPPVLWLTALLGIELIRCMSKVYWLHSIPLWDTWRTEARFFLSAALLGTLGIVPVLTWLRVPVPQWAGLLAILLLLAQAAIQRSQTLVAATRRLEFELILTAMIACGAVFFIPGWISVLLSAALVLIVMAGQAVGRWSFYRARAGG